MKSTKVLIIGAGPSGMTAALCLAKLGTPCVLIERNKTLNKHPKAHELNTRSIEILLELGFTEDELTEEASPEKDGARILFCNTINEEFGRIDLEEGQGRQEKYQRHLRSSRPYLNISQTALEKCILTKVEAHPLIEVLFYHQWQSLSQTDNWVDNVILNRSTGRIFSLRSEFVIAADGAGSQCRESLGIKMKGPKNIQEFASAYFETDLRKFIQTPAKLYWILNPFAPGTFIAHHIDKRWVYMLPIYPAYQKKEQFNRSFFTKTIKTALGDSDLEVEIKSISFWRMSAQLAETYRKGRVLLVGDAAHCFPPTGGLGMNTGMADAHNIGWKISAIVRRQAPPELLDTYELERKPIAANNSEESLQNYHKILEVAEAFGLERDGMEKLAKFRASAPTRWLPERMKKSLIRLGKMSAANKLKKYGKSSDLRTKVKTTIEAQVPHFDRIGLDIGYIYKEGALLPDGSHPPIPVDQVTEYIPSTHPGARFPHLDLSASEGYRSTHDFLSYDQFTLIVREGGQAWEKAHNHFVQESPIKLKLVRLDQLNLPPILFQEVSTLCEIPPNGALLIRPDGHVAFRSRSYPPSAMALSSVFNLILQQKLTEAL